MKFSPGEIAHKSFNKKMMGLDPDEVADFLIKVSAQMEMLTQERNQMRETIRERDLALVEYKERDQILKSTITTASQMADKVRADAERESKLIVNDAHQRAEIITRDAKDSLKKIYNEVADLKKARMQFEANLKAIAQAHLTLLDQGERYMPAVKLPDLNFEA